jgi:plastocyanin domain-containing protein
MMVINLLGLMLIALIVWWFWLYKPNKKSFKVMKYSLK